MTPGRHVPATLVAILVVFVAILLGVAIWLFLRAGPGERPADLTPTAVPAVIVVTDPSPRPSLPPAPTMTPMPEALLVTRVPLTATTVPTPTSMATPEPTKRPMVDKVERG